MTTSTLCCDKCGRVIPSGKGYISVSGWIICGVCQYEYSIKEPPKIDTYTQNS
jgi:hypothetical protein